MGFDKSTLTKLRRFAQAFRDARDRDANESDTVVYLIKFFEEIFNYNSLDGEICTELPIESGGTERYCDFAVRLIKGGDVAFLIEAKKAGIKVLNQRHIEQACNYASRKNIQWVVLTNGVMWQLYHLTFATGIESDLVFDLDFVGKLEEDTEFVWDTLSILIKNNVKNDSLTTFYAQQKLLSPKMIVNVLLGEEVLMKVRQELNRKAPARLEIKDVFHAVTQVFSQDALAAAGGILPPTKKKHRHKRHANGQDKAETAEGGIAIAESAIPSAEPQQPSS
jgi:predicted type IV restriction endonuclease